MPDKSYIARQLAISENTALPESLRQDALFRAVSNSNLHGSEYPDEDNVSPDKLREYINICSAFVRGEIDLVFIQNQAEELLAQNQVRQGFGGDWAG